MPAGPPLATTPPVGQTPAWGPSSRASGPSLPALQLSPPPSQGPGMVHLAWGKAPALQPTQDALSGTKQSGAAPLPGGDVGSKKGKKSGKGTLLMSTSVQRRY